MNSAPLALRLSRSRALARGVAAWIVLVTLAFSGQAWATTPKAMAKAEFDKAQIQYKLGHFEEALAAYSRAYELFPAPAFLFNIGQCQKNLKNHERAIFFFEGYLRDEKNPARRALAEDLLAESKAELEKQQRAATTAPSPAASPPPIDRGPALVTTPPPALAPSPATSVASAPVILSPTAGASDATIHGTPESSDSWTHQWWFWTAVGVGVLGLAGGVVYLTSGGTTFVPPTGTIGTLDRR